MRVGEIHKVFLRGRGGGGGGGGWGGEERKEEREMFA